MCFLCNTFATCYVDCFVVSKVYCSLFFFATLPSDLSCLTCNLWHLMWDPPWSNFLVQMSYHSFVYILTMHTSLHLADQCASSCDNMILFGSQPSRLLRPCSFATLPPLHVCLFTRLVDMLVHIGDQSIVMPITCAHRLITWPFHSSCVPTLHCATNMHTPTMCPTSPTH